MVRILFFLALVFALGLGFAWLADRPGDMVVTFDGYQYQVSLMVAAVAVVAVVAAVMLTWWLIKGIWNSPQTITRYFRVRRRDRGYQALSTGMIAAGAGDAALARKMKKQAAKLISSDQEPLIQLLDAQASLLEGDHDAARAKFEAMLEDPEMRLLGLRGLYLEAQRLGERRVARHYAERASELAPQLPWASSAALETRMAEENWDGALRLLDAQKATRQVERDTGERRRAVILTAKAMATLDTDPVGAKNAALEANRLAPDLVPAALIAAKAVIRQNDLKKGARILEAAWKRDPHPEIGEAYVQARPGDSTHDRLERAERLAGLRRNHVESSLLVGRAALDAGEFALAREQAERAVRLDRREGAYLLLADIEEAETGEEGKVRQHLARALASPRDPAWIADGVAAERWAPTSPVTGKLDAFEWKKPPERTGRLLDHQEKAGIEAEPPALAAPKREDAEPRIVEAVAVPSASAPKQDEAAIEAEPAAAVEPGPPAPIRLVEPEPARRPAEAAAAAEPESAEVIPIPPARRAAQSSSVDEGPVGPPRLPDDPGVAPDDEAEAEDRRFRLF